MTTPTATTEGPQALRVRAFLNLFTHVFKLGDEEDVDLGGLVVLVMMDLALVVL